MSYEMIILCLANSRRNSGRCIAGREVADGGYGPWIRPVSNRPSREISEEDRRYKDGATAQVLDVIFIPMLNPAAEAHQSENHIIDDAYYWEKVGTGDWTHVASLVEAVPGQLWVNGYSSYYGFNDRVPEGRVLALKSSLILVRPAEFQIRVSREGSLYGPAKRRVRAMFSLAGHDYILQVTDPKVEARYLAGGDGQYRIDDAILCVSLSELFEGYAYKLIATVLTSEPIG